MLNFDQIKTLADKKAPLYAHYSNEVAPQPAHIYLDHNGNVTVDYSGLVGAVPADVWNNLTLTWGVTPFLSGEQIVEIMEDPEIICLLERIHAGHETNWDDSNWVGTLTADAQDASEELGRKLEDINGDVLMYDVDDWLESPRGLPDNWPADKTLDEAIKIIEARIEEGLDGQPVIVRGDLKECLLADAQIMLHRDKPGLSEIHLKELVLHDFADEDEVSEYRRLIG